MKANLGAVGFKLVEGLIATCVPVFGAEVVGTFESVNKVVDFVNDLLSRKSQAAYAKKKSASDLNMISNQLQTVLQTRLPWCDAINMLQTSPVFAKNSPLFGTLGPEMGVQFINTYIVAANYLNNQRFGKTKQKIITVMANKSDANIDEIHLHSGILLVKVPNIEHYWMYDYVQLPGISTPMRVEHRWGISKSQTSDCDRVFIDQRIYPAGNHARGGCKLSYNVNSLSQNTYDFNGNYSGLNVRNMVGEGWLYFNTPYTTSHNSMIGQYVDLVNPIYINADGQVITPPPAPKPQTTVTTLTPVTPAKITPLSPSTASFATNAIAVIALMGIAAGFIYQRFKDE